MIEVPRDRPVVLESFEDADGFRCVDIFKRSDGTFGFKEFRRDPEDSGRWTLVADYSHLSYPIESKALDAAAQEVAWFRKPGGSP
jgi:hypothetical protein